MTIRTGLIAIIGLALAHTATAGPYCGGVTGWAPMGDTLPVRPMVVFWAEDHITFTIKDAHVSHIEIPAFTATIDGKRVLVTKRAERAGDIVLHYLQIESDRTGTLEIQHDETLNDARVVHRETRTFTIVRDWNRAAPVAAVERFSQESARMAERTYHGLAIVVDQALAFVVRWRRDAKDSWRAVVLPAMSQGGRSAAWLGETDCNRADVPVSLLEQGIELDATATFPDRKRIHVDGLEGRVKLPK